MSVAEYSMSVEISNHHALSHPEHVRHDLRMLSFLLDTIPLRCYRAELPARSRRPREIPCTTRGKPRRRPPRGPQGLPATPPAAARWRRKRERGPRTNRGEALPPPSSRPAWTSGNPFGSGEVEEEGGWGRVRVRVEVFLILQFPLIQSP